MIEVQFVEGSRSLLQMTMKPLQVEPQRVETQRASDLLFDVLRGVASTAEPAEPAKIAAPEPEQPSRMSRIRNPLYAMFAAQRSVAG